MKIIKLFFSFLFLLMMGYGLLNFSGNNSVAQTSVTPDTYTVTLTGSALNTISALNVTVSFTPSGSAQIDNSFTFKGTGASILLSNVDAVKNIITAVLNGAITDGKVVITGKLKQGSVVGEPAIAITKVEKNGGVDILKDLQVTAVLSSSSTTPTPTPTPEATPTPTPAATATPTPDEESPSVSISGPEKVVLKLAGLNVVKLKAKATNFTSLARCIVESSDTSLLKPSPKNFVLTPRRNTKIFTGVVPTRAARKIIRSKSSEDITISVFCSNDDEEADVDKDITLTAPNK